MAASSASSVDSKSIVHYRLAVFLRIVVAVIGGYAFAITLSTLLGWWLPLEKSHAVMTGVLLSFAWFTLYVVWVFSQLRWVPIALSFVSAIALYSITLFFTCKDLTP